MSDDDLQAVDIADADGDEDEELVLDNSDEENGAVASEPYEIDTMDTVAETRAGAEDTTSPAAKTGSEKSRSRSRSYDRKARTSECERESKAKTERKRTRSRSGDRKGKDEEDFNDSELDSDVDDAELTDAAELEEREMLSMPTLKSVMLDIGQLRTERRVIVHSLDFSEVNHPTVVQTSLKDTCEEIKFNFIRPRDNTDKWSGILVMNFTSSRAAKEAVEQFKAIREDLVIKTESETAYSRTYVENWIKDEKGQKRWTETLLLIKNVDEKVTEEQLKEVFYDAEDIVFVKSEPRRSKDDKKRAAYAVYRTAEAALSAANEYANGSIELEGSILKVYKYHVPLDNPPRGLLKLHERRVVLKYLEKLSEKIEEATEDKKTPEWCTKRHKVCALVIEQDNKCRHNVGLTAPSLDDLRINKGVKLIRGSKRKDLLVRLGVIPPKRRSSYGYDRPSDKRRSGNYGGSSSSHSLLGNPPSLLNLNMRAVPLSLMMRQGGMGYMGGGMTDRRMIGAGEPSNKMLRLDSSGNFHVDRNRRRDDRDDKSRSSKYDRR